MPSARLTSLVSSDLFLTVLLFVSLTSTSPSRSSLMPDPLASSVFRSPRGSSITVLLRNFDSKVPSPCLIISTPASSRSLWLVLDENRSHSFSTVFTPSSTLTIFPHGKFSATSFPSTYFCVTPCGSTTILTPSSLVFSDVPSALTMRTSPFALTVVLVPSLSMVVTVSPLSLMFSTRIPFM